MSVVVAVILFILLQGIVYVFNVYYFFMCVVIFYCTKYSLPMCGYDVNRNNRTSIYNCAFKQMFVSLTIDNIDTYTTDTI